MLEIFFEFFFVYFVCLYVNWAQPWLSLVFSVFHFHFVLYSLASLNCMYRKVQLLNKNLRLKKKKKNGSC